MVNLILATCLQIISQELLSGYMLQHTVRSNQDNKIESEGTLLGHNKTQGIAITFSRSQYYSSTFDLFKVRYDSSNINLINVTYDSSQWLLKYEFYPYKYCRIKYECIRLVRLNKNKNSSFSCTNIVVLSMNCIREPWCKSIIQFTANFSFFTQINDHKINNTLTERLCSDMNIEPSKMYLTKKMINISLCLYQDCYIFSGLE